MTTHVVVSGEGTYADGSFIFRPGATPCDDEAVLDGIRALDLDWVEVVDVVPADEDDREVPSEGSDEPRDTADVTTPPPGSGVMTTRDLLGKTGVPGPEEVKEYVEGQHEGTVTKTDVSKSGFPCRYCDKNLNSSAGRATHERVKHPDEVA